MSLARRRQRLRCSRLRVHFEELTASDTLPD